MCSSSGGQSYIRQHLVSSHFVGGRPVHGMRCVLLCLWIFVLTREQASSQTVNTVGAAASIVRASTYIGISCVLLYILLISKPKERPWQNHNSALQVRNAPFNITQSTLHIPPFLRMTELTYHIVMLHKWYHNVPAMQTVAGGARHVP